MLCYLVSMVTSTVLFRLGVPMSYASTVTRLFPCTYNINIMNIILIMMLITIIIYINDIILTNTLAVIHENYHNYSDHHKYHNYITHIYYETCQNLTHRIDRIFIKVIVLPQSDPEVETSLFLRNPNHHQTLSLDQSPWRRG